MTFLSTSLEVLWQRSPSLLGSLNQLFTISGPTLQHAASLPYAINCLIASFIFETKGPHSIFTNEWSPMVIFLAIVSGLLAVGVNVCGFGLIGKTNAITFSVVGHVKTMLIFIFGLIMFKNEGQTSEQLYKQIAGLSVAMTGVILYTYFEIKNKQVTQLHDKPLEDTQTLHQGQGFEETNDSNNLGVDEEEEAKEDKV